MKNVWSGCKADCKNKDQHPAGSTPTIATTMWNKSPAETTGQNGTQQFALQNASLSTPVAEKGIQLIPALTRIPAYIDTAVDSDNPSSKVIATIPAGPGRGQRCSVRESNWWVTAWRSISTG